MSATPEYSVYFRLMRIHQPTGVWLLLWPCWWSVALASPQFPSLYLMLLFFIGAFLMRPAGCILNDIVDRKLDASVERTKSRPLASGEITVTQAWILFFWLLLLALLVALALGKNVLLWSALALPLVALYPWMKRITGWPQLFLGLTFNWGALLGWIAVRGVIEMPALLLYAGGVFWTLGYDTIYAHQDKADDARIGIKSTALTLGKNTRLAVLVFYGMAVSCWMFSGYMVGSSLLFYGLMLTAWLHLAWQANTVDLDNPESCRKVFMSNSMFGWLVLAAYFVGHA